MMQRAISEAELDAITVIKMPIEKASAKVNARGPLQTSGDDYDISIWAGVIPARMMLGTAIADKRLLVPPALPAELALHYG